MKDPVKVLLVDDSRLYRARLKQILEDEPAIEVVAEASNGEEAIRKTREVSPDLIIMDVIMPVMDGITAVRSILRERAVPILVLTAAERQDASFSAFAALEAGALDVMAKPASGDQRAFEELEQGLAERILGLSRIKVITQPAEVRSQLRPNAPVFLIAASTGGPQALNTVLRQLPKGFASPVVVVQHISHGFLEGLVQWLARECPLQVQIADDRTRMQPGHVYFAPTQRHLKIRGHELVLADDAPVNGCKPAADVLFASAAAGDGNVVAIVLTGMGSDGLEGSRALSRAGRRVLVQSPATCAVAGMPAAVLEAGQASEVLELDGIANEMLRLAAQSA